MNQNLCEGRIAIFTGNRAEFGLLFPLIVELSKSLHVDLYISSAHVLKPWNTIEYIENSLKCHPVNLLPIYLPEKIEYEESFGIIYNECINKFKKYGDSYRFSIVLGDRIETYAFALSSFYSRIPIIHIYGGDIENTPYYDASVRHSISKISHVFFTSNEKSTNILKQIGEEEWRIFNIGNLSLSYLKLGFTVKAEEIIKRLRLMRKDQLVILFTYHPSHAKSIDENREEFESVLSCVLEVVKGRNIKIVITYPNNDPGYKGILKSLQSINTENIVVKNTLGTDFLVSLFKNFNVIVVGNSSMGLFETAYFGIPAINIGDRQIDRFKAKNVLDIIDIQSDRIKTVLNSVIDEYQQLRHKFLADEKSRFFFGDENSVFKAIDIIKNLLNIEKEKLLYKKFVVRDCK